MAQHTFKVYVRVGRNSGGEPCVTAYAEDDEFTLADGNVENAGPHHDYVVEMTAELPAEYHGAGAPDVTITLPGLVTPPLAVTISEPVPAPEPS